jgi:hypothetical protein
MRLQRFQEKCSRREEADEVVALSPFHLGGLDLLNCSGNPLPGKKLRRFEVL